MKKSTKLTLLAGVLALSVVTVASCGQETTNGGETPTSVVVTYDTGVEGIAVNNSTVNKGSKATAPTAPEREGYTFVGWYVGDAEFDFSSAIESDVTLTAKWVVKTFKVTVDGVEQTVEYGKTATVVTPTKDDGSTFKGWVIKGTQTAFDVTAAIKSDVEIESVWEEPAKVYTVTFDGKDAVQITEGEKVEKPADPTKAATAEYTYTFDGWYNGSVKWNFDADTVSENLDLVSKFNEVKNKYTVTFDGTNGKEYEYGSKMEKPADPTKTATAEYTYTFDGWYNGSEKWDFDTDTVSENLDLVSKFNEVKNKYAVTFDGANGKEYEYGSKVEKPTDPTKAATAEYTYTFDGWYNGSAKWDFDTDTVSENLDLVSKFNEVKNKYAVTFDGTNGKEYEYGAKVEKPADPTKAATAEYTYTFDGWYNGSAKWDFDTDTVSGNLDLVSKFIEVKNKYAVTFDGANGKEYEYGSKVEKPDDPTKAATAEYTYTFDGWYNGSEKWNFDADTVSGNLDLVSKFNEVKNKYAVTFDGTNGKEYEYGSKVEKPDDPTKAATAEYTYTFDGWYNGSAKWDFDADTVSGNLDLVSKFNEEKNKYTVTFDGANGKEYEYGSKVEKPNDPTKAATAEYTYTFDGWYNGSEKWNFDADTVSENLDLVSKFNEVKNKYTVTFDGANGKEYEYGSKVEKPADPTKAATAKYTYIFDGWYNGSEKWNFDADTVSGNLDLVSKFNEVKNKYTVTFDGANGKEYEYGAKVEKPNDPTKAATAEYTYTFDGWYNGSEKWNFDTDTVSGNIDLVAKFTEVKNKYAVTFDGANGKEYEYGSKVEKPAEKTGWVTTWYNGETEYNFDDEVISDLTLTSKRVFDVDKSVALPDPGTVMVRENNFKGYTEADCGIYKDGEGNTVYYYSAKGASNAEARFVTVGTDTKPASGSRILHPINATKVSLSYRMYNNGEKIKLGDNVDGKVAYYFMQLMYKSAEGKTAYIQYKITDDENGDVDGEWHDITVTIDEKNPAAMGQLVGIIIKAGNIDGELMVKDVDVEYTFWVGENATNPTDGILHFEGGKTKGYDNKDSANGDPDCVRKIVNREGNVVTGYYFTENGDAADNCELRFVTAGSQTKSKPYTLVAHSIRKITFWYKMINTAPKGVKDKPEVNYITQVIAADGTYPIYTWEPIADGQWHEYVMEIAEADVDKVAGIVVKMGGMNGELIIAGLSAEMTETEISADLQGEWTAGDKTLVIEKYAVKYDGKYASAISYTADPFDFGFTVDGNYYTVTYDEEEYTLSDGGSVNETLTK